MLRSVQRASNMCVAICVGSLQWHEEIRRRTIHAAQAWSKARVGNGIQKEGGDESRGIRSQMKIYICELE